MTLIQAAIAVLVTSGGALPFLLRLARKNQVVESLPAPLRKEIAQDLPTIIQVLQTGVDPSVMSDHIHAGTGTRPILHVDVADAGTAVYYELGATTTAGANPDLALVKVARKIATVLSTNEAPVDPDVKALAADTNVTSPVADQPGGDVTP